MSYITVLERLIAWDGYRLASKEKLVDDITFRRCLTDKFSPNKPYSKSRINEFIQEEGFEELLRQAIRDAARDLAKWVPEHLYLAPEQVLIASGYREESDPTPRELWTARQLVFQRLIANEDFSQFLLEYESMLGNKWFRKLLHWGEATDTLKAVASNEKPEKSVDIGTAFRDLYRPLTHALMYVLPIAVGARAVGDHLIEKQQAVKYCPTINVPQQQGGPGNACNGNACNGNVGGEPQRIYVTLDSLHPDPRITQILNSVNNLQTQANTLQTKINEHDQKAANSGERQVKVMLSADDGFKQGFDEVAAAMRQLKFFPEPSKELIVRLGNVDAKQNAGQPFNVTQAAVQLPYPFQNNPPATPSLVEFTAGNHSWDFCSSKDDSCAQGYTLKRVSNDLPYRFLLTSKSKPNIEKYLSLTKTPQYADELKSYLNFDTTSRRSFWLFGDRHVVLRVAPNSNDSPTPKPTTQTAQIKTAAVGPTRRELSSMNRK